MSVRALLLTLMLLLLPNTLAMAASSEKYEGIEITVNVNQASAEEIATLLSGIGMKKAQAIVDYRTEFGDFGRLEELTKVKGIGEAILDKNRTRIEL